MLPDFDDPIPQPIGEQLQLNRIDSSLMDILPDDEMQLSPMW